MVMLYLMVGGPSHGTWKEVPEDRIRSGVVSIPHMRNLTYEKASEFGVPGGLDEARYDRYQLRTFDLVSERFGDGLCILALVWMGMPLVEMAVGDAFHAACDPGYIPAWRMPKR